jgi:hypothetical protein
MRPISQLVLTMACCRQCFQSLLARGVAYMATYVDVTLNTVISGAALPARYRAAPREVGGMRRFNMPHQIARPDRFAILEVWRIKAAPDGHDATGSTSRFRDGAREFAARPMTSG